MTIAERQQFIESLGAEQIELLLADWPLWARRKQMPPDGDWRMTGGWPRPRRWTANGRGNCRFIARLGLAVGGKSGGFAQGLKQRRVSLALFGDALHGGFGRAGICNRFGDAAFNRIMPL